LSNIDKNWSIKNVLNLLGVYSDLVVANDKSKVLNFHLFKLALFWSEVEVTADKNFKDAIDIVS